MLSLYVTHRFVFLLKRGTSAERQLRSAIGVLNATIVLSCVRSALQEGLVYWECMHFLCIKSGQTVIFKIINHSSCFTEINKACCTVLNNLGAVWFGNKICSTVFQCSDFAFLAVVLSSNYNRY